jgi:hypothetical protein
MTVEELEKAVEGLSFAEKGKLLNYIVSSRNRQDPSAMKELQARLDDKDPSHWIPLSEVEARLSSKK